MKNIILNKVQVCIHFYLFHLGYNLWLFAPLLKTYVALVKPFLSICFTFIFIAVSVPRARFPESFVVNSLNGRDESDNAISDKSILGMSAGESSRSSVLDLWTLVIFVTGCLFVNKTILKPATSIFASGDLVDQ